MKFGIVVDSGCDITNIEMVSNEKIEFNRAALKLQVGDKEFIDDFNLNVKEFMKEMTEYKGKTGSAAPSPGDWYKFYEQSDNVFAVTITGALSGSYASAQVAKNMLLEKHPEKNIHLIDSKSAGPEITLIVYKLVNLIAQGLEFEEIVEEIEKYRKHTNLLFVLESLDNLVKNGRVSKVQGAMAGLLGIKIMGCASEEGMLEVLKKSRGKLSAYDKAVEEMISRGYKGAKVIISHCFNDERAEYLKSIIKDKYPKAEIKIMATSGLCSYYAEKGGILIGFEDFE
ncbi:DegV family protein [Clostridium polynesiense]|uniref:DegV family protein n=1 Tax=Clostridium polynesiense TaxID=1325933 RepID=UPI00058D3D41|nr:DegV family protein [Clostridium polynesiense]